MSYQIYAADDASQPAGELAEGYSYYLWRPTLKNLIPPTLGRSFILWTFAHYLGLFANRDYSVLFVTNPKGEVAHRSCVIPAYFRWPFMARNDIQISSTWTNVEERGKGLATFALVKAMQLLDSPGRKYWYVSREQNIASIAVCKKAGFRFVGQGKRVSWMGIRIFGKLILED